MKRSAVGPRSAVDARRRWSDSQNNEDIPAGGLRIDFPDYDSGEPLQEITWAEFFDRFEEENLTFIFQEEMVC